MRNHVCVASLFFNPSYASHLAAFGKAFVCAGVEVGYVLHEKYKSFGELAEIAPTFYYGQVRPKAPDNFTHVFLCNAAIGNPTFARAMKRRGCKVIYLYHEPTISVRKALGKQPIASIARLSFSRIFSRRTLSCSDLVVLPSREASQNYRLYDWKYNDRTLEMPLIFDDGFRGLESIERTTFSYIGATSREHGFDQFVGFMRYALRSNLGIRFLVASKQAVHEDDLVRHYKDSITLKCGKPLTSEEINECYAQSLCVWNLYRICMQSGVMANAFMCGAPVIASRTGSFLEYVKHGFNGRFADVADHAQIVSAFGAIAENFSYYSENSRKTFMEKFYYGAQMEKIEQILALRPDSAFLLPLADSESIAST
ncbi:MAG: glycosyltransferase [Terriglobia bacterium]